MSKRPTPIKNIWDKTTQTDNKLTISNRLAKAVEAIRSSHSNVSEGKAIEGLITGEYDFNKILSNLKKEYHDI
jgi:hypothetical protein